MLNIKKYLASLLLALFLPGMASATLIDPEYEIVSEAGGRVVFISCDTSGDFCDVSKDFLEIDQISIRFFVDGAAGILDIQEDVLNLTGIHWTDYHFQLVPEGDFDGEITFEFYEDAGEFSTVSGLGTPSLDVQGGAGVPNDDFYLSFYTIAYPVSDGQSSFLLNQVPTIAVPEPTTLLLMGIGLTGLGFARRRRLNA